MKRKIIFFSGILLVAMNSFAGVTSGYGNGEAAACADAKNNVPYKAVKTSGCYCDSPRYEGGKWRCNVDYEYK
ncbi:hypothetical protein [Acinetobacter gerneri]|uniref:hypothetical protein n=1 Tax=Acinetobacter gerneri TaxID=202952 RepID=UPI0028ADE7CC|nr:hypothetical protein [Acinetobacter gerneri]